MTDRNQILNRHWIVFALLIGCLTSVRLHAVIWDYSTTDGTNTISGQFETDGVFADTQGTEVYEFTIEEWTSWKLNGNEIVWIGQPPTVPDPLLSSFKWNQRSNRVNPPADSNLVLGAGNNAESAAVQLAFLDDPTEFVNSSFLFETGEKSFFAIFTPTSTVLTPVPEPKEYALIFLLLLGGIVIVRQHNQSGT